VPEKNERRLSRRSPQRNDDADDVADRCADQDSADRDPVVRLSDKPKDQAEGQQCRSKESEAERSPGIWENAVVRKQNARRQRVADTVDHGDDCGDR
jgi:hypothetical protein